jgi:hypothetical protein
LIEDGAPGLLGFKLVILMNQIEANLNKELGLVITLNLLTVELIVFDLVLNAEILELL